MDPFLPFDPDSSNDWALLNDICDRFEVGLRKGILPPIADQMAAVPDGMRGELARELSRLVGELFLSAKADLEGPPRNKSGENHYVGSLFHRFELKNYIGCGGFGFVFLADDKRLGRSIALKIARSEIIADRKLKALFLGEVKTARKLEHPNLIRVLDAGEFDDSAFVVSEYESGLSLKQVLAKSTSPLDCRWAAWVTREIARGINHAHEAGVIHCDLNPGNVIIGGPNGSTPKAVDFGIARVLGEPSELSRTGELFGTPGFIAPEQATGRRAVVDGRTDVYGLGAILYACLMGTPPFHAENTLETLTQVLRDEVPEPRRKRRDISPDLQAICLRCLEKIPHKRYQTAAALGNDLDRFLNGQPTLTRPPNALARISSWAKKHPAIASTNIAGLVGLLGGLGFLVWHNASLQKVNQDLTEAVSKLDMANTGLQQQRDAALARTKRDRLLAYAADIRQAALLLDRSNLTEFRRRMDRWQPKPEEDDIRGWEWHYLNKQAEPDSKRPLWSNPKAIYSIDFSPDGKLIAEGGEDGLVRLIDANSGREIRSPLAHPGEGGQVGFSSDGRSITTSCDDGVFRIWPTGGGPPIELRGHKGKATVFAYSPDGCSLATGGFDKTVRVWDLTQDPPVGRFLHQFKSHVTAIAWDEDGTSLFTGLAEEGTIANIHSTTGKIIQRKDFFGAVARLFLLLDGRLVAVFKVGTIQLWDTRKLTQGEWTPLASMIGDVDRINGAAISADGKWLALARERRAEIWRLNPLERFEVYRGQSKREWGIQFSPDGSLLATGGSDGGLRLWDIQSHRRPNGVRRFLNSNDIVRVGFDSNSLLRGSTDDGTFLTFPNSLELDFSKENSTNEKGFVLWSKQGNDFRYTQNGEFSSIGKNPEDACLLGVGPSLANLAIPLSESVRVAQNGKWAACHDEQNIHVIGLGENGKTKIIPSSGRIAHFSCGVRNLAAASIRDEKLVRVWNVHTGQLLWQFPCDKDPQLLDFSPDEQKLAVGFKGFARVWDLTTGLEQAQMGDTGWQFSAVLFSQDGRTLVTGGWDGSVRLYQPETGEPLLEFPGGKGPLRDLSFSLDGFRLASVANLGYGNRLCEITVRDATPGKH